MKRPVLLTLALTLTAAAAQDASVTKTGVISLTVTRMNIPGANVSTFVGATAIFQRLSGPTGTFATGSTWGGLADTCAVLQSKDVTNASAAVGPQSSTPGADPASLDAGDPITLRSGHATYATLTRRASGNLVTYTTLTPVLPPPPASLVADVPGTPDGFPAFTGAAFPSSAPIRVLQPEHGANVEPGTVFTWANATHDPSVRVLLTGAQQVGSSNVIFTCFARDDGSFAFPDATRKELGAKGFTQGHLLSAGRTLSRSVRQGDALLTLNVTDLQMFAGR